MTNTDWDDGWETTPIVAELDDLMDTTRHHGYGPSSSHTWMFCAAAPKAQEGIPNIGNPHAELGSAAHALGENTLRDPDANCADFIGEHIYTARETLTKYYVTEEMADYVQGYVNYVRDLVARTKGVLLVEKQVSLDRLVPGNFGTADAIVIGNDGTVYVVDLKYGMNIVYIKHGVHWNTQAMSYALGVLEDYGFEYTMDRFQLTIYQPRKDHVDESELISTQELLDWATWGHKRYLLTLEENPVYTPGPGQCRWCRARHDCKPKLVAEAAVLFEGFDEEEDFTEQVTSLPLVDVNKLGNDDLGALELRRTSINALLKENNKEVLARLKIGQKFSNVKMVVGKGVNSYKDEEKAIKSLSRLCGIDVAQPRINATPAGALLLKTKKGGLVSKTSWGKSHTEKLPGGAVVASIDDNRTTVEPIDLSEGFDQF